MELLDFIDSCNISSKNDTEIFTLFCYYLLKENGTISYSTKKMMHMFGDIGRNAPDPLTLKKDAILSGIFRPHGIEGTLRFTKESFRLMEKEYEHLWAGVAVPVAKTNVTTVAKVRLPDFADACEMSSQNENDGFALLCYYLAKERGKRSFYVRDALDIYEDAGLVVADKVSFEKNVRKHQSFRMAGIDGGMEFFQNAFSELDSKYGKLWDIAEEAPKSNAPTGSEVLDETKFSGKRSGLDKLIVQVNSSYRTGSFDSCALVMRRLLESALIYSFQNNGTENKIIGNDGKFLCFSDIVQKAIGTSGISQVAGDLLAASAIGDYSEKGAMYTFGANDINSVRLAYRNVLEALLL